MTNDAHSARRVKLIVSDVDGTFLPKTRILPTRTREFIGALRQQGVTLALASSRPPAGMRHILEESGLAALSAPYIAMNGAVVVSGGATLVSERLEPPTMREIYDAVRETGVNAMILDEDGWWSSGYDALVEREAASLRQEPRLTGFTERLQFPANKITLLGAPEAVAEARNRLFVPYFQGKFTASSPANPKFLDITPYGAHKGTAIERLAASLGVARDEICALGDGENDVEMFRVTPLSIAMAHASAEVRAAATYIAEPGEEAWLEAVQRYVVSGA